MEWKLIKGVGSQVNCSEGQSEYFAKEKEDRKAEWYALEDENKVIAEVLLCYDPPEGSALTNFIKGRKNGSIEVLDGPIFLDGSKKVDASRAFFKLIEAKRKQHGISNCLLERTNIPKEALDAIEEGIYAYKKRLWATLVVDLEKEEKELYKNLKHSVHLGVNKARRQGLSLRQIKTDDEMCEIFSTNLALFKEREREAVKKSKLQEWRASRETNCKEYYVTELDGKILSTVCLAIFGDKALIEDFSYSVECREKKIAASDFMIWELMLEMKRRGIKNFDLAGINPDPKSRKEFGIRNFKEKWGGEYVEYYEFFLEPRFFSLAKRIYRSVKDR